MPVVIGAIREVAADETRVGLTPEVAGKFIALGGQLLLQRGLGSAAGFPDAAYAALPADGVRWTDDADAVLAGCDVLLAVQPLAVAQVARLKPGATVAGFMQPHARLDMVRALRDGNVTSLAMELVPRISRAQSMDALSSQAAAAGYKAVLIAAQALHKFLPMLTTAAGTIRPAQVLVVGAGVAGLQAIATARRLGAVVEAYDVRGATREQVQSLGAKFIDTGVSADGQGGYARELTAEEQARQQAALDARIAVADAVITTAAIPGRAAPRIVSRAAVERMKPGAVIVDIAAESGGNCELTRAGATVEHQGVRIIGPLNLPAQLATHASEMYARNLLNLLQPAIKAGTFAIDWDDEVFAKSRLTHAGAVRHEATRSALS